MKRIGAHIFDWVARFKSSIFIADVPHETQGSINTKVLVVDSDGEVQHRLASEIVDDGFAFTPVSALAMDFTSFALPTDTGLLNVTSGSGITAVGDNLNTLTINADIATNTIPGVASFPALDFSVTNGAVSLSTERLQDLVGAMFSSNTETNMTATYQDSDGTIDLVVPNIGWSGNSGGGTLPFGGDVAIAGIAPMTTALVNNELSIEVSTATASTIGVAKFNSADFTVTDGDVKLNTQSQLMYMPFTGKVGTSVGWGVFNTAKTMESDKWTKETNVTGLTIGTAYSAPRQNAIGGLVIPYDCELVGFYGVGRNNNSNTVFNAGLFVGTPNWGASGASSFTLQAVATADKTGGGGNSYMGACKLVDLSRSYSMSAGDTIIPAMYDGTGDDLFYAITVVLKKNI